MHVALIILAIVVTVAAGTLMIKGYSPVMTLIAAGLILLTATVAVTPDTQLVEGEAATGNSWLDIFALFEDIAKKQLSSVGLIIMTAAGFSAYMDKIGATHALVDIAAKPMQKIRNPYLVLVLGYLLGQALFIVVPSAAGLAMLLIVTILPIMVAAGVSPAAGVAAIVTTTAFPIGPATGTEILAAKTAEISPVDYFLYYQLPVALPGIIAVAIAHFYLQQRYDAREAIPNGNVATHDETARANAPRWYAIFLLLPVVLLIVLSPISSLGVEISTVGVFILVWLLAVLVELIRQRGSKEAFATATEMFKGMGRMFGTVVALIIGAQFFAEGLMSTGAMDALVNGAKSVGVPLWLTAILFTLVVGAVTVLTGSGVGSFSVFAPLSPGVAEGLGGSSLALLVPMQLAGGLFRAVSPIAGVVITAAGAAKVSPFELVRRTAVPMAVGTVVMMIASTVVTL